MSKYFQKIYFDPYLFFSIFFLSILGLFFLFSASNSDASMVAKQLVFIILGFVLMITLSQPDPALYRRISFLFFLIGIASS
mgnify:CR=1 FL=1